MRAAMRASIASIASSFFATAGLMSPVAVLGANARSTLRSCCAARSTVADRLRKSPLLALTSYRPGLRSATENAPSNPLIMVRSVLSSIRCITTGADAIGVAVRIHRHSVQRAESATAPERKQD